MTASPVANESSIARRNAVSARSARSTFACRASRRTSATSVIRTASVSPATTQASPLFSSGERTRKADVSSMTPSGNR